MHLATISVVTLVGLAAISVGNTAVRAGRPLPLAIAELAKLSCLTIFWFTFFHVLNS